MAQNIKLKRSAVPGKVPTTSSLDVGEIAINTTDGKLFFHASSSASESIQHIVTTNSITTGSIAITNTGSFGELVVTQDGNFNRDIFVTRDIVGNGDIDVAGSLTASLTQGYVWVGGTNNITKLVTTSSFIALTDLSSLNTFSASQVNKDLNVQYSTASLNIFSASAENRFTSIGYSTSSLNSFTSSQLSLNNQIGYSTSSLSLKTGSYATTGSNFFNGSQTISGSLIVSSSTAYLQVDGSPNSTILSIRSGSKEILLISSSNDLVISGGLTVDVDTIADYLTVGHFKGTQNNYLELAVQNLSSGISASTDIVAYADNGSEIGNFIDVGINGSGTAGGYNYGGANDAYVYNTGGNLYIGNNTAFYQSSNTSQSLFFFANATATPDMVITGSRVGIGKSGSLNATLDVNGRTIISGALFVTGALSASLQQGYIWVGDSNNRTAIVPTSSLGGGSSTPNAYTHTQGVAVSTWTVQHNLNNSRPVVTVYDINNNVIVPENIRTIDANQTEIRFTYATTGYATVAAAAGTVVTSATSASFATNALTASYALAGISGYFGANFDGQGVGISPGSLSYFRIPKAGTITAWSIVADGTWPTMSLNVWKTGSGAFLPTSASTIIGTLNYRPFISASRNAIRSTDLTSWTTSFAANDIFAVQVVSSSIATKCNFVLECQWTV